MSKKSGSYVSSLKSHFIRDLIANNGPTSPRSNESSGSATVNSIVARSSPSVDGGTSALGSMHSDYLRPAAPDLSQANQELVKVIVGDAQLNQVFWVYKNFISFYAPVLLTERETKCAYLTNNLDRCALPEIPTIYYSNNHPEAFGIFVRWLYTQKVVEANGYPPLVEVSVWVYFIGVGLELPRLQNLAIHAIQNRLVLDKTFTAITECLAPIYQKTEKDDALRRLSASYVAWGCQLDELEGDERRFGRELLLDVVKLLKDKARKDHPTDRHEIRVEDFLIAEEPAVEAISPGR